LDEPTNDLDLETLDLLQDILQEFQGAVLLVSHDRFFLDQVCQRILALDRTLEGEPEIVPFAGIDQWEIWHEEKSLMKNGRRPSEKKLEGPATSSGSKTAKLSYKEQREWDGMEEEIKKAEAELEVLQKKKRRSRCGCSRR
jgi:ATP-binding cassette subfamily F protein uup